MALWCPNFQQRFWCYWPALLNRYVASIWNKQAPKSSSYHLPRDILVIHFPLFLFTLSFVFIFQVVQTRWKWTEQSFNWRKCINDSRPEFTFCRFLRDQEKKKSILPSMYLTYTISKLHNQFLFRKRRCYRNNQEYFCRINLIYVLPKWILLLILIFCVSMVHVRFMIICTKCNNCFCQGFKKALYLS